MSPLKGAAAVQPQPVFLVRLDASVAELLTFRGKPPIWILLRAAHILGAGRR